MHLFDCAVSEFIPNARSETIAKHLDVNYRRKLKHTPSTSEITSWRESLGAFARTIDGIGADDAWIVLEYQLPIASTRVDAMLIGRDQANKAQAVLLEFKQWPDFDETDIPEIVTIGGRERLHPCAQVMGYRDYIRDAHSAFVSGKVGLHACAFLHESRGVSARRIERLPAWADREIPLFTGDTSDDLARFVGEKTRFGATASLVDEILHGTYQPSKALLTHVADAIAGHEPWALLDEQRLVYNRIIADVKGARESGEKRVIIVRGGPGTGKSVIAAQVVGRAAREGYAVVHATGSKAFTTNMRGIVGNNPVFRYFFHVCQQETNAIELTICDEAHRLRSHNAVGLQKKDDIPQARSVIRASQVSVFLLDGEQSVRKDEIGTAEHIIEEAATQEVQCSIYDLDVQFRCAGSASYLNWINHFWSVDHAQDATSPDLAWRDNREYDVQLFDTVEEFEDALKRQYARGMTARMVAGFCWPWSNPQENDSLVEDVVIGSWKRPWNRKPKDMFGKAAETPKNHPYTKWANDPRGFGEIGCIYSAQGFEFDYVGVIVGDDIQWDDVAQQWRANLDASEDSTFVRGLKKEHDVAARKLAHIYRVLSTRGMQGCYFYFLNSDTKRKFEKHLASTLTHGQRDAVVNQRS